MIKNTSKLATDPYKGVRDFYPADLAMQNYIFQQVRTVVRGYGYNEYNASILEESALYRAKTGEEIVNQQTYNFIDRGGREVTLRPEMTPSVARMIAGRRQELVFPLRWFNIGSRYRYEKPQRGRQREFWQIDVDCFGLDNPAADVEIIKVARDILESLGAADSWYEIRINHRGLMNYLFADVLKLDEDKAYKLAKLIDQREKIEQSEFLARAGELTGDKLPELMDFLQTTVVADLKNLNQTDGYRDLIKIIGQLTALGVTNYRFDPALMRGFDYYTGMVFEIFDTDPVNKRSLVGGGRYDNLVGIFGVEPVSGVGFGSGDVTLRDFLQIHKLLPDNLVNGPDFYICLMSDESLDLAWKIADDKRKEGAKVEIDFSGNKLGKQLKTADKKKAGKVIVIGEDEKKSGRVKIKDMTTGLESEMII